LKKLKAKKFSSEAKKSKVNDQMLSEILDDFLDLDEAARKKFALGAGLYKLRLASKSGRGKSGGSRSILAFKHNDLIIWLHLFDKNDKGNISPRELKKLKILADILLGLSNAELQRLIEAGELLEVAKYGKH
jgi:hypothetical protein